MHQDSLPAGTTIVTDLNLSVGSKLFLRATYGPAWRTSAVDAVHAWVKGSAFRGHELLDARALSDLLAETLAGISQAEQVRRLAVILRSLNGYFALVVQTEHSLFASADRIRSLPLYYGERDSVLCLSDDAEFVRQQVRDRSFEPLNVQEFRLTGYVTGAGTLFPNVMQLQAGELLVWTTDGTRHELTHHRYSRFLHTEPEQPADDSELIAALDTASEASIRRLIRYADGRQIVVPLSAGLDSRLIVTLLRRQGYENVLTFSYGDQTMARESRAIAASPDYPWAFAEYSRSLWRLWWQSPQRRAFMQYAGGLSTTPHVQDWPAIWVLRERGEVASDAVLVPGHCAMLAVQANMTCQIARETRATGGMKLLRASLWESHYALRRANRQLLTGPRGQARYRS